MTDLKKLLIEFDTLTQKNRGLSLSKQIDLLESTLLEKFSVTLRGDDSSVDNNKVEQSINQTQMMDQIEDMTCDFADDIRNSRFPLLAKNTANFSNFKTRLKDCFTMHFNVDPKPSNDLVEQSTIDEELISKIEDMAIEFAGNYTESYLEKENVKYDDAFTSLQQELKDLFKTHRNTVFTAINQKDDNLVDEEEFVEKIETLLFSLSTTMIEDYYGDEVIAISGKNRVAKEIVKLFKTHQNTTLKPSTNKIICDDDLKSKFKDIVVDTICRLTEDDFRCLKDSDTFKLFETKLDKLITDNQLKFLNGGLLELFDSVDGIAYQFAMKVKFDGARETLHHFEFKTELSKLFKEFVHEVVD